MKDFIVGYYEELYGEEGRGSIAPGVSGQALAADLGYPEALLRVIPAELWADFLPCGNVLPLLELRPGDVVLNLGCGVGIDSLALGLAHGTHVEVINLDTAFRALQKGRDCSRRVLPDFRFIPVCADGSHLPFGPETFDAVILNGVFNLFEDKRELAVELQRVVKHGGRVAGADLCRRVELPGYFAAEPEAWAWCMSGALATEELRALFQTSGFREIELVSEIMDDYFDRVLFVFRKSS